MKDKHGREIMPGDLIRVFHYRDRRTGRKCFMHKLVVRVSDDHRITNEGPHLFAVDVVDIWQQNSFDAAHKCRLDVVGESVEIIDGALSRRNGVVGELVCWYERDRDA